MLADLNSLLTPDASQDTFPNNDKTTDALRVGWRWGWRVGDTSEDARCPGEGGGGWDELSASARFRHWRVVEEPPSERVAPEPEQRQPRSRASKCPTFARFGQPLSLCFRIGTALIAPNQ